MCFLCAVIWFRTCILIYIHTSLFLYILCLTCISKPCNLISDCFLVSVSLVSGFPTLAGLTKFACLGPFWICLECLWLFLLWPMLGYKTMTFTNECIYILCLCLSWYSISVPSSCCIYHGVDYVFDKQLTLLDLWFSWGDFLLLRTVPSVHLHQQPAKAHSEEISR